MPPIAVPLLAGAVTGVAAGAALPALGVLGATAVGIGTAALTGLSQAEQKKKEGEALSLAEEQEVKAREEAREREGIVLEATEMTPEEKEAEATRLIQLKERAGLSGEELLRRVGPQTRTLLDDIAARQGLTGEQLFKGEGRIPEELAGQVLAELQDPNLFYESTLKEDLELSRQMVNAEANKRGVFGGLPEGGIRFEQLGRAGVELAIKSAQERMLNRQQALVNASALTTQFLNLRQQARGEAAQVGEAGLSQEERARAELDQFLQDVRGIEAGGTISSQQLGAGITGGARETATAIRGGVIGGGIQQAAETQQAGLDLAGELIGGGIESRIRKTIPTAEDKLLEEQIAALEEDPRERITMRAGKLPAVFG